MEHTADVGLHVWAPTLDELFAEAAAGLIDVMGRATGEYVRHEDVALEAPDLGALFVDWLSEVLFLFEARSLVPCSVAVRVDRDPLRLEASIDGPDAGSILTHGPAVKAVTYHGLEIIESSSGCHARVYLDV